MSRSTRAIRNLASGYIVLGATVIYSLASVPLALHYLTKERFALWALMTTISGYLALIDLGMSSSVARLLIDHKDEPNSGVYGSLLKTGWLVLVCQGLAVFGLAISLSYLLPAPLKIALDLRHDFTALLQCQGAILLLSFSAKIFNHLLYAHQRLSCVNFSQVFGLLGGFITLWLCFHLHQDVYSLAWAGFIGMFISLTGQLSWCLKLKLFPSNWGRVSREKFHSLFSYGSNTFLVAVGAQLISASQPLIITRCLGLEQAALWNVGTRVFTLCSQVLWRPSDVSGPAFCEMMVRGERALLRERYKSVVILTASLSGLAAVSFAYCNSLFVLIWTHGKFYWPPLNDALLAFWMVLLALIHCHNGFVLLTKDIRRMQYIYILQGCIFVVAALVAAPRAGLSGILVASILCDLLLTGAYGVRRIAEYFTLPIFEVVFSWLAPMAKIAAVFIPLAMLLAWATQSVVNQYLLFGIRLFFCLAVGVPAFLRFGLPHGVQQEALRRLPKQVLPLARRVLAIP